MADWQFEHSIFTKAKRKDAWHYMSNMDNHAKMEPGVEKIELDGPFEQGSTGRTITADYTQNWKLTEVKEGERFVITGSTPDGDGTLSFAWDFEDEDDGTRMIQRIKATAPLVEQYHEELQQMEANAPEAMEKLASELDRITREK